MRRWTMFATVMFTVVLVAAPVQGQQRGLITDFVDGPILLFGSPKVEPGSEGHMVSHWGYFEGPCMRAGDWALARTMPTDRFQQFNTHGPIMPWTLRSMAAYQNQAPDARFNCLTSCYGGNRYYFVGRPDATALARLTGRPTVAFRGSVAIWEDQSGRTNVMVQRVPLLRFTRPPVERMASVHYPDGRVKVMPHPERLFRGAVLQPGKNQVSTPAPSSRGGVPITLSRGSQPVQPMYMSTCQKGQVLGSGALRMIPPVIVASAGAGGVYDAATNPEYDPSERILIGGGSATALGVGTSAGLFVAGETATGLGAFGTGSALATGGTVVGTGGLIAGAATGGYAVGRTIDWATGNRVSSGVATGGCAVYDTVAVIWRWKFDYSLTGNAYDQIGRKTSWTGF